jgi:hypothetical protein
MITSAAEQYFAFPAPAGCYHPAERKTDDNICLGVMEPADDKIRRGANGRWFIFGLF